jgi:hypothetical protein
MGDFTFLCLFLHIFFAISLAIFSRISAKPHKLLASIVSGISAAVGIPAYASM